MSKYKPHILLSQENTQIRDLQQENRGEHCVSEVTMSPQVTCLAARVNQNIMQACTTDGCLELKDVKSIHACVV